jgi:hypothetical protein
LEISQESWLAVYEAAKGKTHGFFPDRYKDVVMHMDDAHLEWSLEDYNINPDKWHIYFIRAVEKELENRAEKIILNITKNSL